MGHFSSPMPLPWSNTIISYLAYCNNILKQSFSKYGPLNGLVAHRTVKSLCHNINELYVTTYTIKLSFFLVRPFWCKKCIYILAQTSHLVVNWHFEYRYPKGLSAYGLLHLVFYSNHSGQSSHLKNSRQITSNPHQGFTSQSLVLNCPSWLHRFCVPCYLYEFLSLSPLLSPL